MAIINSDCLIVMRRMAANCIDSIVTDPPYGLKFMGKDWDHGIPGVPFWAEALRVAKPGCHLLAFGGTRTFHRLTCAIEDAGWEIRDCLGWLYGSGFPKSHNLKGDMEGWGTALKPAWEPIILARKPLEGTVAANAQKWGTGCLNIDWCRVGVRSENESGWSKTGSKASENRAMSGANYTRPPKDEIGKGRWPANFIHSGEQEVMELFPQQKSPATYRRGVAAHGQIDWNPKEAGTEQVGFGDSGSAARFFKCCKFEEDELCESANVAETNLNPSSRPADSVLNDVQTLEALADVPSQEESQVTPDFITNSSGFIPNPDLVLSAEGPENTGTTPTIASRLKSSGCVRPVIGGNISRERNGAKGNILLDGRRLIYTPKASRAEREMGCEGMEEREPGQVYGLGAVEGNARKPAPCTAIKARNHHPTVKPLALMRYLCRLVTPPNGLILDPFAGSGTTGIAARDEHFRFIGIEKEPEYCTIAKARIKA